MASGVKPSAVLDAEKIAAARAALRFVRDGMTLGLGTGSTSAHFITLLGERVRDGLRVGGVPSSLGIAAQAKAAGIPLIEPRRGLHLDLDVDGADEIAPDLGLIKGGGGALLREKVVARASRRFLVIADSSKLVQHLGSTRGVPIEVVPFAVPFVADELAALGAAPVLREDPSAPGRPMDTDQGNHILDCRFRDLSDPRAVAAKLDEIAGIVDHGLFLDCAYAALIADGAKVIALRPGLPPIPAEELSLD